MKTTRINSRLTLEEKETILIYDSVDKMWKMSTTILKHMNKAKKQGWIQKEEIGAIIVVSLCPDHFVPQNSNIIQGALQLDSDVICMDIPQGCCGFVLGLSQAFMLLEHLNGKKVVLVNGDVLS